MELQKPLGLLKQAYYQGHGRYVPQLIRMTIKFCKTGGNSREMRRFIETDLVNLARANPGCVIYVKPRLFKAPALTAEYMNDERHYINLYGMSKDQIGAWMNWFITRSGEELYKLRLPVRTYYSSVQGHWTPFRFRDSKLTLSQFPDQSLSICNSRLSATEQLRQHELCATKA